MRVQPDILRFFDKQARAQRPVTFVDLVRERDLTPQGALSTLELYWRHGLIAPLGPRPSRFKRRLAPRERLRDLSFRLTQRGRERITWWNEHKRREEGTPWPF